MNNTITQPYVHRPLGRRAHSLPPAAIAFLWSRTGRLKDAWQVVQALGDWPNVAIVPDRGGLCLTLDGVRLGHLLWNGRIDLPFGPEAADRLIAEKMATRDPNRPDAGRVVFDIHTKDDVNRALWLFRFAYLIADSSSAAPATDTAVASEP
jgi:hypothetical protein